MHSEGASALPTLGEIRARTQEKFGRRPCLWQCKATLAQLRGEKDVVCISSTGSGKTLTFWMPLLFRPDGIQIIITPLNVLGSQNSRQLAQLGISAFAFRGETATATNFQAAEDLTFRVIVASPELAVKPSPGFGFDRLWRNRRFMDKVIGVVWDEGHCISSWGRFREEYLEAARIRHIAARSVRFYVPSATLPEHLLRDVMAILQMRRDRMELIRRSNDRPNVFLTVQKIRHPLTSFKDLEFLIPENWTPSTRLLKFLVFFDNIEESVKAAEVLQKRLPPEHRDRIVWFNANNSHEFREESTQDYQEGKLFGLYCTDSFGMGMDVPDIELVVQWRPTCDLNSVWQRFGRAARDLSRTALAVLFVDAKHFDDEKIEAAKRKEKAEQKALEEEVGKRARGDGNLKASQGHGADDVIARRTDTDRAVIAHATSNGTGPELTACEKLRVLYKQAMAKSCEQRGRTKKTGVEGQLGPEMDILVNAGTRAGLGCYRVPIMAYFENDRAESDHHACSPDDNNSGCTRCHVAPSTICCSLCNPNDPVFAILTRIPPLQKASAPRASKVPTDYTMTATDVEFRIALNEFRRELTLKRYGLVHLNNLGAGIVMGDETLERVADCARAGKITMVETLYQETKWPKWREYGAELINLVNKYYPSNTPFVSAPLRARQPEGDPCPDATGQVSALVSSASGKAPRQCGACGQYGHISA
ncbi:P-loop containing nucleoside triphosphate hydrolase protein [Ganoderma leucocontextum]|nr:P-loop containing nucleoside triphosphate hydrolase protein [Ganoderma leucocontextum]